MNELHINGSVQMNVQTVRNSEAFISSSTFTTSIYRLEN